MPLMLNYRETGKKTGEQREILPNIAGMVGCQVFISPPLILFVVADGSAPAPLFRFAHYRFFAQSFPPSPKEPRNFTDNQW